MTQARNRHTAKGQRMSPGYSIPFEMCSTLYLLTGNNNIIFHHLMYSKSKIFLISPETAIIRLYAPRFKPLWFNLLGVAHLDVFLQAKMLENQTDSYQCWCRHISAKILLFPTCFKTFPGDFHFSSWDYIHLLDWFTYLKYSSLGLT